MSAFKRKLKEILREAELENKKVFDNSTDDVLDFIEDVLVGEVYLKDSALDYYARNGTESLMALNFSSFVKDAIGIVREKVIKAANGKIKDIVIPSRLRGDYLKTEEYVSNVIKELPERGFIYLAWNQRPRMFLYLGKASSSRRVENFDGHGKLSTALMKASTLTLLFPNQSTPTSVAILEAAMLAVLGATDNYPELNEKPERLSVGHEGEKHKQAMADFFGLLSTMLTKTDINWAEEFRR